MNKSLVQLYLELFRSCKGNVFRTENWWENRWNQRAKSAKTRDMTNQLSTVAWRQLKTQPGHFQRLQQRLETNQGCRTKTSYSVKMLTAVFWQLIWNRRMRIVDFTNVMVRWSAESLIQIKWKLKKKKRNPLTAFNLFSVRTNLLHYKKHNICFYAIYSHKLECYRLLNGCWWV